MNRKSVLTLAVVLAIAVGTFLWWRAQRPDDEATRPVVINIATFSKALGNLPYHVAKHSGWFDSAPGLEHVTFTYGEFNDRPTISNAFSSGELQILFSGDIPSIITRAQGNDISVVALTTVVTQNVLVRSDLPSRTLHDLKGKRLAVLQGTSSHYCLLKVLRDQDLQEADFDLRYMSAPEAKVAFETRAIDAWAVWAPFVEQQEVSGTGRLVEGADATINSVMTISRPFIARHPNEIRVLVAVIQRARTWIRENPEEAQRIAAEELGLDLEVVKRAWPKHDWGTGLTEAVLNDLQEKADFLAEEDRARARIDVRRDYVDLRFTSARESDAGTSQ